MSLLPTRQRQIEARIDRRLRPLRDRLEWQFWDDADRLTRETGGKGMLGQSERLQAWLNAHEDFVRETASLIAEVSLSQYKKMRFRGPCAPGGWWTRERPIGYKNGYTTGPNRVS